MPNDYKLGKGKIYVGLLDAAGALIEGERYMGNTPGFEIAIDPQTLEHFSSESGISEKDAEVLQQLTRTFTITFDSIDKENLALFLIGDAATKNQSGSSVTSEAHAGVQQGQYYQLGASSSLPAGVRGVSSVVVNGSGGTPTHVENTDYTVDLDTARIYIVPGGGISDDDDLEIDYDLDAVTWDQVTSSSLAAKEASIRFIADNPKGSNHDLFIQKASVRPSGSLPLIGEDWQQGQLEIEALKPASGAAVWIDGRPVASA